MKFKIDIFENQVIYFSSKKKFDKYMLKKTGCDHSKDTRIGLALELQGNKDGSWKDIIYSDGTNSIQGQKCTVVHEISHIVDNMCSRYVITCGETRAYLSGYIYKRIIKHIDKKN